MGLKQTSISIILAALLSSSGSGAVNLLEQPTGSSNAFPLVDAGRAACVILPPNAPEVIKIAAHDLAGDISLVSGVKPEVLNTKPVNDNRPCVELVIAPDLSGRWEAFRLTAKPEAITIAGSDRRGLAYGIYELSRRIGVSPWQWWADVPAPHHSRLLFSLGTEPVDQPAVKYRGIFINDEDWGLQPWAAKTFEPEVGNIGPKTYARIFELLLRLRGNLVWPAMHPTTTPFHLVPGNSAVADKYAIIIGSSHAEPMLRNNLGEWKAPKENYNYLKNRDEVLAYWEERVKERVSGESLFTIGMRGIHDSPIIGPKTQPERIATLEKIFADQRDLLGRHIGRGDPTRVPQLFCPYKEVLDDYNAGLKVPDDVTILLPDDNFGYVRRYPTPAERTRRGGLGVYYHSSYLGLPFAWTWIDVLPPALMWSEMTRAYEQGARTLWVNNVGDIKNTERSMEYFLDLAWHADRAKADSPANFVRGMAARDFGREHAKAITDLLSRLEFINFARRVEFLQWHLSRQPYKPTELNESEIDQRLTACQELQRDSDKIASQLPPETRNAYFELVGYPVGITAAANERYFRSELARADVARGRSPDANRTASSEAQAQITNLTARYNNEIAGGKWRYIVTSNGVSPKDWLRFQRDTTTVPPEPAPDNVCPPAPPKPQALSRPPGARPGDFVERDGVVSMNAANFNTQSDAPSGAGWHVVQGLGRAGSAITLMPSTAVVIPGSAPSVNYRFHVTAKNFMKLHLRFLPTFPLVSGQGLRVAVAIDDEKAFPVAVSTGFDTKSQEWMNRVLANATEASCELPNPLSAGPHTLRLVGVDAGVVIDKIVLDLGGLQPSYDGPAETRLP